MVQVEVQPQQESSLGLILQGNFLSRRDKDVKSSLGHAANRLSEATIETTEGEGEH